MPELIKGDSHEKDGETPNLLRLPYIDVAKGIGILLVMFQHCRIDLEAFPNIMMGISSFEMPLFFLLSGWLHKQKDYNMFFASRCKTLLIPWIVVQYINFGARAGCIILGKLLGIGDYSGYLILEGFWFLQALLFTSLAFYIVNDWLQTKNLMHDFIYLLLAGGILAIGLAYSHFTAGNPSTIVNALVGYFFYTLGFLLRKSEAGRRLIVRRSQYALLGVALFIISVLCSTKNSLVSMAYNNYGNEILFLLSAIVGCLSIICLAKSVSKCKVLEFFGKNSLVIVTSQFPIIRITKKLLSLCFGNDISTSAVRVVLCMGISCICQVGVIIFVNRFFPLYAGKYIFHTKEKVRDAR